MFTKSMLDLTLTSSPARTRFPSKSDEFHRHLEFETLKRLVGLGVAEKTSAIKVWNLPTISHA